MKICRKTAVLAGLAMLAGAGAFAPPARAGNEIRIPLPPLPPLPRLVFPKLPDPRDLIPIPRINTFVVPDIDVDIVFRDGYWWTPRDGEWLRSDDYRGPYLRVPRVQIPVEIIRLPPRPRAYYHKEKRIPYGQWKKTHGWKRDRGGGDRGRGRDRDRDRDRYHDEGRDRGRDRDGDRDWDRDRGRGGRH